LLLFFRKEGLAPLRGEGFMPTTPNIVLVLQGGGALGAYHVGAYQAMAESSFLPDWICGNSIGAINAAILAGNTPDMRLRKLRDFWHAISWPAPRLDLGHGIVRTIFNTFSNAQALTIGQPNFFSPRALSPLVAPPGPPDTVSFYDTAPLLASLPAYADFALINQKAIRLSLGATDVETGNIVFFDNTTTHEPLEARHVLASGSLPPGFPATRIGDAYYWDGGCVSNTPLEAVLQDMPAGHTIVFMIDLWNAAGPPPRTLSEVVWREKQIQYASRTDQHIDAIATKIHLRHALALLDKAGAHATDEAISGDAALTLDERLDIVHITYRPEPDQISTSDAEFSRESIADRSDAGYRDMKRAIAAAPWFQPTTPAPLGAVIHCVDKAGVKTLPELNLRSTSRAQRALAR
jgi:NTE family protein